MAESFSQLKSFLNTQGKGLSLLLMMAFGILFPQAHVVSFLIQYLLMVMLFFAFLDIEFKPQTFQKSVIWVLLVNVTLAFISYVSLARFNITLAMAAFMTAIAPTAIAAPVVISFIEREVEYVVAAVLVTNVACAIIVPIALPSLLGAAATHLCLGSVTASFDGDVRAVDSGAAGWISAIERTKRDFVKGRLFPFWSGWGICSSSAPTRRIFCATVTAIQGPP